MCNPILDEVSKAVLINTNISEKVNAEGNEWVRELCEKGITVWSSASSKSSARLFRSTVVVNVSGLSLEDLYGYLGSCTFVQNGAEKKKVLAG